MRAMSVAFVVVASSCDAQIYPVEQTDADAADAWLPTATCSATPEARSVGDLGWWQEGFVVMGDVIYYVVSNGPWHPGEYPPRQIERKRQRQERKSWLGAHRGEVAEICRHGPVHDSCRRREAAIEVNAFDQGVDGQHLEAVALGRDHRGVIANRENEPVRWRGEPGGDACDEIAFAKLADLRGSHRHLA